MASIDTLHRTGLFEEGRMVYEIRNKTGFFFPGYLTWPLLHGQIIIIWLRLTGRKFRNLTKIFLHFLDKPENF